VCQVIVAVILIILFVIVDLLILLLFFSSSRRLASRLPCRLRSSALSVVNNRVNLRALNLRGNFFEYNTWTALPLSPASPAPALKLPPNENFSVGFLLMLGSFAFEITSSHKY
jgi:hypothetical protein